MSHFNAIMIGGPPHSGKSVLTYSLTQALRRQGVDHYVLRACPDGEGDWSTEARPETVRMIRMTEKRHFTPEFVAQVTSDLGNRHLPLLVDVGGKPKPEQEIMFAQCTHAVLIARDEEGLAEWRALAARTGLAVIAEVISSLDAEASIQANAPIFKATLNGLERHHEVSGPVFDALVLRLSTYLFEPPELIRQAYLSTAPVELVVELPDLAHHLEVPGDPVRWLPEHLPPVLAYLPGQAPLALYGRGPNWLFAAVAVHAQPAAFHEYDARLGWVSPAVVSIGTGPTGANVDWRKQEIADYTRIELTLPSYYLDYWDCRTLCMPPVAAHQGIVLSGRMPHWLLVGLVIAYRDQPWVAVYQPHLLGKSVVVASQISDVAIGQTILTPPPVN